MNAKTIDDTHTHRPEVYLNNADTSWLSMFIESRFRALGIETRRKETRGLSSDICNLEARQRCMPVVSVKRCKGIKRHKPPAQSSRIRMAVHDARFPGPCAA